MTFLGGEGSSVFWGCLGGLLASASCSTVLGVDGDYQPLERPGEGLSEAGTDSEPDAADAPSPEADTQDTAEASDEAQQDAEAEAGGISLEQAPPLLAASLCAVFERCIGAGGDLYSRGEDCTQIWVPTLEDVIFAGLDTSLSAGRLRFHPEFVPACLDAYDSMSCEEIVVFPGACKSAVEGRVALGQACYLEQECAGEAYCDGSVSCPGMCKPLRQAGETCAFGERCEEPLTCFNKVCAVSGVVGSGCGAGVAPPCRLALYCIGEDYLGAVAGECVEIVSLFTSKKSQACNIFTGPLCEQGLSCTINNVCVSESTAGSACAFGLPDPCPAGLHCMLVPNTFAGTCEQLPVAGQPCVDDFTAYIQNPCGPYLRCVNKTCRPLARLDEWCEGDAMCYGGSCEGSMCAAPNSCQTGDAGV